MRPRPCLCLVLAGIGWLGAALPGAAQEGPSRRPYVLIPFESNALGEPFFGEALKKTLGRPAPEALRKLQSRASEFGMDRPEAVYEYLKAQSPEKRKELERTLEKALTQQERRGETKNEPASQNRTADQPAESLPKAVELPQPVQMPDDDWLDRLARTLMEKAEQYDWDDLIKNSPSLREGAEELKQWLAGGGGPGQPPPSGLARWASELRPPDLQGLKLPALDWLKPDAFPSLPSFNLNVPQPDSLPGIPHFGLPQLGPAASRGQTFGNVLLWLALAAIAVLICWQMLRNRKASARVELGRWQAGPWPVHPANVATPEELIKAFEHLSLLQLGPDARSWNHHAIAFQLEDQSPEDDTRRRAARELATFYERARYAPASDALTPQALASARRDLCLLAGMAGA